MFPYVFFKTLCVTFHFFTLHFLSLHYASFILPNFPSQFSIFSLHNTCCNTLFLFTLLWSFLFFWLLQLPCDISSNAKTQIWDQYKIEPVASVFCILFSVSFSTINLPVNQISFFLHIWKNSIMHLLHNFILYSSAEVHLVHFNFLAIVNRVASNFAEQTPLLCPLDIW